MTLEEVNARYVCHNIRDVIVKSSVKGMEEIILFCFELSGNEDGKRGTEEWTNLIDRGGLWHINECTYTVSSI